MKVNDIERFESSTINAMPGQKATAPWFSWTRPQSYRDVVVNHMPVALVAGIALLLSCLVPLHLLPLLPCTLLRITGYPCPFCGFTRSFWALSAGDWNFALYNYPLAALLYGIIALVFVWNAGALIFGVKITRGFAPGFRRLKGFSCLKIRWIMGFISVLFLINWIYRLSMGLK
jgi:hypothetical protein